MLIAASFEGWVGVDLLFFERFALILAAVMLIATKVVFNVAGLIIGASVLMIVYLRNRRSKAAAGVV